MKYKDNLTLARNLAKKQHADRDYYDNMVNKLEKMLNFYEKLKVWKEVSEE